MPKLTDGMGIGLSYLHARDVIDCARLAESLGFSSIWTAEDHYYGGAFTLASASACATRTVIVGVGVVNPFTRHPVTIAMEAAALRQIAEDRLVLGLGSTGARRVRDHLGMSFAHPANAVAEAAVIVRRCLAGELVVFNGRSFQVDGVRLSVELPAPDVPILFGVLGPLSLRAAGTFGDGLLLSLGSPPDYVRYTIAQMQRGASESARTADDRPVAAYMYVSMDEDADRARAAARPFVARLIGLLGDHPMIRAAGLDSRDVQPFQQGQAEGRPRADLVTDRMVDAFALAGTRTDCQRGLARLLEAGVTHPIVFESPLSHGRDLILEAHRYLVPVLS